MVSFSPDSVKKRLENFAETIDLNMRGYQSQASIVSNDTAFSKRALSHYSDRTSTTESSLHLQGRTKEGDHDEMCPFINEEKFQAERITAQRGQRERDRRQFLQEHRGIQGICYRLMQNQGIKALCHIIAFLTFILVIILANAAADMLRFPGDPEALENYRQLELLMTVLISLYIVEVIISFIGAPITPRIYDGWLVLDIFIASLAFLDEFVVQHFQSLGILRTTRAVRLLRILRVGRVMRVAAIIRSFPLIALVMIETTIRLAWMFTIWSVFGWCSGAIITVITGAEAFADLPIIEDPLINAIIDAGQPLPLQPEEVLRGLGGTLLLMNLMPMRIIYWGPSLWKLLWLNNLRLNAAAVCLMLYCAVCVVWIWPMVVGTFISVLREGQSRITLQKAKAARKLQEFSVEDLIQIFEATVGDNPERFVSLEDFRDMQKRHPNFAKLLGGTGDSFAMTDAVFRGFDIMNLNFLTLPDFVLGVLKLIRVLPKPEFNTMDEQQRRALKNFSKAAGGNRFSFLVTNRYINEFRAELHKFVASSAKVIQAEVREASSTELESTQLPDVMEQEEKQLKSSWMAKLQEKYDFRQRLLHAEESLKYLSQRQQQEVVQHSFKKVADDILNEDILPLLLEQMPSYVKNEKWRLHVAAQRKQREAQEQEAYLATMKGAAPRAAAAPAPPAPPAAFPAATLPASAVFFSTT